MNPVKLVSGLWRRALARGVKIYAPVQVDDVVTSHNQVRVKTSSGRVIEAGANSIASTWAYATRSQEKALWPSRCLIWEAADPYLYARTTASGQVVVGGEDEEFSDEDHRDRLLPAKIAAIERKLRKLMPRIDAKPVHPWCGSFGSSPNGLPLIGPIPRHPNCCGLRIRRKRHYFQRHSSAGAAADALRTGGSRCGPVQSEIAVRIRRINGWTL